MYTTLEKPQLEALQEVAQELGFTFTAEQPAMGKTGLAFAKEQFYKALDVYLSERALSLIKSASQKEVDALEEQLATQEAEHTKAVAEIERKIKQMGSLA